MAKLVYDETGRLLFTKEMKEEYTLLMPQMLPVHFSMMQKLLQNAGFKVDMLTTNHRGIVDEGLKYVHNDTCSSPRPAAAAGPPTTSTCCARPWRRRIWPISPWCRSIYPVWRRTPASS